MKSSMPSCKPSHKVTKVYLITVDYDESSSVEAVYADRQTAESTCQLLERQSRNLGDEVSSFRVIEKDLLY